MKYLLGYITTKDKKEAEKIAMKLLQKKLIACVNIIEKVLSAYWWQGKIVYNKESLLIIKTKTGLTNKILETVKKIHSYKQPEIIFNTIKEGDKNYLKWINKSTI